MVKRTLIALSITAAWACSGPGSAPKAAREGPLPAAAPSWLGEHEYRSTDGNGSLSVVKTDAGVEATLEVAQTDGCTGGVGGALDISGRRARLAPPLFRVEGSTRHAEADSCTLEFGLRDNGTIDVTEPGCTAYHGINCGFASDYPPVVTR